MSSMIARTVVGVRDELADLLQILALFLTFATFCPLPCVAHLEHRATRGSRAKVIPECVHFAVDFYLIACMC